MSERRLKALVRGAGYAVIFALAVVMFGGIAWLLVALWIEAGPGWVAIFLGACVAFVALMRFIVAVALWADEP